MPALKQFSSHLYRGDLKTLFRLSLPLSLLLSADSIVLFFDNLFLARFSLESLKAHALGYAFVMLFQIPSIRMAAENQLFVSQACSTKATEKAGIFTWQMIWLSLISMLLILPLSFIIFLFSFNNSSLEIGAKKFFIILMSGNFLFPLSAALNSFQIGKGKTWIVLIGKIFKIIIQPLITAPLIFGISPFLPPLGLFGAAIGNLLSEFFYCLTFFVLFLTKENRKKYGTSLYFLSKKPFLRSIKIGGLSGLSAIMITISWTIIARSIAIRESDFLIVIAYGLSINYLLTFLNLGLGQAASIISANCIGAKDVQEIKRLISSYFILLFSSLGLLIFPFLIYPHFVLTHFFPDFPEQFSPETVRALFFSSYALWFFELAGGIDRLMRALLTAAGDTLVLFMNHVVFSFMTCLPVYMAFVIWKIPADFFWFFMVTAIFSRNIYLFFRLKPKKWTEKNDIITT